MSRVDKKVANGFFLSLEICVKYNMNYIIKNQQAESLGMMWLTNTGQVHLYSDRYNTLNTVCSVAYVSKCG